MVEYYQNEGGKELAMKDYERDMVTNLEKGIKQGNEQTKEKMILNMCRNLNFSDEDIANVGEVSVSEVVALR